MSATVWILVGAYIFGAILWFVIALSGRDLARTEFRDMTEEERRKSAFYSRMALSAPIWLFMALLMLAKLIRDLMAETSNASNDEPEA